MSILYTAKGNKVWFGQSVIVTVWVQPTDEARLPNESWLGMRERTKPVRLNAEQEAEDRAKLIASFLNPWEIGK